VGVVAGEQDLLEVVGAFHPVGGFPDLLHGGQEQADQDGDDGDDDEQLDERKPPTTCHGNPPGGNEKEGTGRAFCEST
jgi:hypothetical protein